MATFSKFYEKTYGKKEETPSKSTPKTESSKTKLNNKNKKKQGEK